MNSDSSIIFVVESCQNCKEHQWNTRHVESKYQEFFQKVAAAIIQKIPNAMVMKNQIPKDYLHFDLYNNLVPNEEEDTPYFQQVPRTGSFEVSYKGYLIFSKQKAGYWPNCELVAEKCLMTYMDDNAGKDCSQYLHGQSPMKDGGMQPSGKKGRNGSPGKQSKSPTSKQVEAAPFSIPEDKTLRDVMCSNNLRSPEDLSSYPVFPHGTKSLLSKYLTRQVWDECKDKKDKYGFSFQESIFSGCKNVDSGIGVYAGSHEAYRDFAPLMDQVIQDYHGHSKTDKHQAESASVKLNAPDFPEDEAKMIRSTRIRVGRNLEGLPLGPAVKTEDRAQIEKTVTRALQSFDGELKGTYYSLSSLSETDRNQLIDDHFLFKEGDRFLEACGLNRDWPANRGIYHNDDKTFLVWVNEEDQLRIISMQQGSNIRQVFQRLMTALEKFESVSKFSYDDHLGFITSCPTNLGTAMRASVHIHLPLLGKKKAEFQSIADQYHVQIRGAHGEHTETDDGIFDISNVRRLGYSMTSLVQDMYDGVKAMIKREKELMGINAPSTKTTAVVGANVKAGTHLKKPEDITGMVDFPAGTKSSLCRFMSKDIFNKYFGKKDKQGVSFEQMILSGSQNIDSGIGVYAGSHDAYYTFGDLFDQVIEDYHQHKKADKHVSDMDYTKLNCPPFSAEDASMIVSTRIRVGRNLAEFPLGPGISKDQRDQVEKYVKTACESFEGELSGKYYSLATMSKEDQNQLIEDHFLFKEGDRFLESSGLNRDWPAGRGIFHNAEKTFLIWVNEEDQLRIISMQKGADIGAVFTRLSKAAAQIEKLAKFSHDDHLGYITSCPTNLGTALRASVHIKLPFLAKNKGKFNEIADKFYVQIRGIHGEHTETDDGVFDISNKRRLGRSEKDLVQDMYNGVKAMIEAEKALANASAAPVPVKAGPHLKKPEDITGMVQFPAGTKSSLCRFMSEAIYNQYRGQKDKQGVSFEQMILSGSQNIESGIGVYAGSHDAYYTFGALFDQVIEDYHKHPKDAKHISNMNYEELDCPPFSAEDASMIVSTRIRVGRNLAEFPLGPGISKDQRDKVEQYVKTACESFEGELSGTYYSLATMSKEAQNQLIEDHFLFKEGDKYLESSGLNRDWPSGRGIFHNKEKTFLIWVNEEDQLRIISMQKGADIGAVFTRLSKAATLIEQKAKFAHDDHLGYITSCPTNLGTALRASVHIKLPFLANNKDKFNEIADKFYVQIRGIHGEHTETDDGVFDISNKRRLGRSEKDLVQDMYNGVKAMIAAEKELSGGAKPSAAATVQAGTHLQKPEDITGMVEFPEGTKSSLCRFMSTDIYNKYKGQKCKNGVSFEQMILSGSQNIDSGIGVYAGSHDAYYTFSDLFDQVIEDYHKHGKDAKHVSNMNYEELECPPFSEEDSNMIVSTRIRVGRNLAEFPLGPGISKEQRDKVEEYVKTACESFEGELAGQYYSLKTMTPEDQKQLIEDHFLFKEGDRFLESSGLNREWPDGRGIFHNKEKTFLIWVNEEDQLRIISMQKGADIGAVFTRLSKAAAQIEKLAKFSHDEHLGYITSCPTNLGTALRASVHIKLPFLAKNKEQFNKIADEFYVQIRGIHGEHTETDDGVFDISNKRRLGRSEKDLVQDMYNGVKAMIEAEKKLASAQ